MPVKEACSEFLHSTTIGGIPRIFKNKRIGFRLFWVLASIVVYALVFYYMCAEITAYLSYPTRHYSSEQLMERPPKPVITICAQFPFPASRQAASGVTSYAEFLAEVRQNTTCNNCSPDEELMDRLTRELMTRKGYFQYLTQAERSSVGPVQNSLILECDALLGSMRTPCTGAFKVTERTLPDYFTCFEYSALDNVDVDGLELTVFLDRIAPGKEITDTFMYSSLEGPTSGIRVITQNSVNSTSAYGGRDGFDVPAGVFADVSLQLTESMYLGAPYGSCEDDPDTMEDCQQRHLGAECGCTRSLGVAQPSDAPAPVKPYCMDPNENLETLKDRLRCMEQFVPTGECVVPMPCSQRRIDAKIHTTRWPSSSQVTSFLETMEGLDGYPYAGKTTGGTKADRMAFVDENFIRLRMAIEKRVRVTEQVAAVTLNDMLARIAWTTCMLCGFTLFFVFEVLDLLFKMCCGVDKGASYDP